MARTTKTSASGSRGRVHARKRSKTSRRTTIEPHKGDRRYVRRTRTGQFKKEVNVGRSLAADQRRKARTKVGKGQGDRGDAGGGIMRAVKRAFGG
jgi:hypothetical protein